MVVASASHLPLKGSRRYQRTGSQVLGRSSGQEWSEVTVKVRRKAPLPEPVAGRPRAYADLVARHGAQTTTFGSTWLRDGRQLGLLVPSAVLPEARNILINPVHPQAAAIRAEVLRPFAFDARLL